MCYWSGGRSRGQGKAQGLHWEGQGNKLGLARWVTDKLVVPGGVEQGEYWVVCMLIKGLLGVLTQSWWSTWERYLLAKPFAISRKCLPKGQSLPSQHQRCLRCQSIISLQKWNDSCNREKREEISCMTLKGNVSKMGINAEWGFLKRNTFQLWDYVKTVKQKVPKRVSHQWLQTTSSIAIPCLHTYTHIFTSQQKARIPSSILSSLVEPSFSEGLTSVRTCLAQNFEHR